MVPGWDFTANTLDAGEPWTGAQASAAVLDGVEWVNPSAAASVDQASAAVLDDGSHAAYGHGTMVAGVVHLAAPTARIMPLRAFTADGHGSTSDIVHAIYFAALKGAKVLNMSFSRSTPSGELKLALDFANLRGLIAVSSAGNQGTSALAYPAAYASVIGVASTANDDTRSTFSNYGSSVVWLAAPGEGIVTTYPGGRYAAAWGTSFSTPYVAGTAALLATLSRNVSGDQAAWAVAHARLLAPSLNNGRLDVVQAVRAARTTLFPYGGSDPVPATCGTDATDWSTP
jgi:subtilisin family serine protease